MQQGVVLSLLWLRVIKEQSEVLPLPGIPGSFRSWLTTFKVGQ